MNAEEISSSIITASPQQAGQLVDVVVRAFISDPPSRWVFPDEQQYPQYFPQFVRALGGNAFTQGAALATADYSGAALWLAPDAAPDEEALGKLIEDGVAAEKQAEMAAIVRRWAVAIRTSRIGICRSSALRPRARAAAMAQRCFALSFRSATRRSCRRISN